MSLSEAEQIRRKARYFWDTRHTDADPETWGYGWDDQRMFRDLERAEDALRRIRAFVAHSHEDDGPQVALAEIGELARLVLIRNLEPINC